MKSPLTKIAEIVRYGRVFGPYVAEIGRVSFVTIAVFGLLSAVGEAFYPGFVINWISPKSIMGLGTIAGLLALWPNKESAKNRPGWLEGILGLFFALSSFWAAWYYFEPVVNNRFGISLTVAVVIGLSFFLLVYGEYFGNSEKRQDF